MPESPVRRSAADARRVAKETGAKNQREAATEIRQTLRQHYEQGKQEGYDQALSEMTNHDVRSTLLTLQAEQIDLTGSRITGVPNSARQITACREAAAILRDAAKHGDPAAPEPEPEPKRGKTKKK